MYSRTYPKRDNDTFNLPSNYDGTAFSGENTAKSDTRPPVLEDAEQKSSYDFDPCLSGVTSDAPMLGGIAEKGKSILTGVLGRLGIRGIPRIGAEEILIIATALFLLFSKEGDSECAILLLLLLLIN